MSANHSEPADVPVNQDDSERAEEVFQRRRRRYRRAPLGDISFLHPDAEPTPTAPATSTPASEVTSRRRSRDEAEIDTDWVELLAEHRAKRMRTLRHMR